MRRSSQGRGHWALGAAVLKLRSYRAGSFKAHRTGRRRDARVLKQGVFFIGQTTNLTGNRSQERAKFHTSLGSRRPLQDVAYFGLGAAPVQGSLDADCPMHFIG
ncbi:Radical SAM superfamily enzyme YgiQ [Pseudomonas syringae pv. actinidiae]|uniref:Radical SAM superfamily enzyme YgiQ n=1 Tax=Pseudomonas syringae pv. actinidiae TaxID=103796 RepID=A0AAN4Q0B3_PSESF|nr:Radical SAM superfamily enzyme YgiQ [Pseudomonas syringae pv. actinidiae]